MANLVLPHTKGCPREGKQTPLFLSAIPRGTSVLVVTNGAQPENWKDKPSPFTAWLLTVLNLRQKQKLICGDARRGGARPASVPGKIRRRVSSGYSISAVK